MIGNTAVGSYEMGPIFLNFLREIKNGKWLSQIKQKTKNEFLDTYMNNQTTKKRLLEYLLTSTNPCRHGSSFPGSRVSLILSSNE